MTRDQWTIIKEHNSIKNFDMKDLIRHLIRNAGEKKVVFRTTRYIYDSDDVIFGNIERNLNGTIMFSLDERIPSLSEVRFTYALLIALYIELYSYKPAYDEILYVRYNWSIVGGDSWVNTRRFQLTINSIAEDILLSMEMVKASDFYNEIKNELRISGKHLRLARELNVPIDVFESWLGGNSSLPKIP